ncbi:Osmosensing histidine kinase SLN1-like protein [Cladobotryum mycophilum]|uniref:Osmosensing histidine kinase SLN1-like protein n=1 Tax=Cladobotryum mycophilum TaxID=491253 RepID=A0ABR0SBA3_9HYPO
MAAALMRSGDGTETANLVLELSRERETVKYEPFLRANARFNETGRPLPSSELSTSGDSVLTALAQLATYQTNTDRALISLFDTSHQYFIAEAVPLLSLAPRLSAEHAPQPLWLCGTAIPRSHGVCESVLCVAAGADRGELPLTLVPDLTNDARFVSKLYGSLGRDSCRFYAAVPIRTPNGIDIGVLCVLRGAPSVLWDDECTRRLRDISHTVMGHLESKRSNNAHRRSQRMNRGLGSFIEGKTTISGWQCESNSAFFINDSKLEGELDAKQQLLESQRRGDERQQRGRQTSEAAESKGAGKGIPIKRPHSALKSNSIRRSVDPSTNATSHGPAKDSKFIQDNPNIIFSKAANIIRESFEVEGCLFFDVTSVEPSDSSCKLLGFSTSAASSINGATLDDDEAVIPRELLTRLLRRYPNGKIFDFDSVWDLQRCDACASNGAIPFPSIEETVLTLGDIEPAPTTRLFFDQPLVQEHEMTLVQKAFPDAHSVAFIPVWDSKRELWLAGGFIYTLTPTRVFTIEGELSFFKAFAMMIVADILKLEVFQVEKAKSDALSSLSHELRSPLHGVILGTELLIDTDLSVFQENATHTIETCCRTLLDTIDHLLDYSKVNSFEARRRTREVSGISDVKSQKIGPNVLGNGGLSSNVGLDALTEEVIESVFAGFNFQHMSISQFSKQQDQRMHSDVSAHKVLDSTQAMEQLGPDFDSKGEQRLQFGNVSVYISIDPTCNWMFNIQPGAFRRILMNLFANSLAFTNRGNICVSLSQEDPSSSGLKNECLVKLMVQDTGKGISQHYLQHGLFKPFSQEDELAPGTGMGLTIVKMIASQVGGNVTVQSQVGIGTTVIVLLPLEQLSSPDDAGFKEQVRELQGLHIRLLGFDEQEPSSIAAHDGAKYGLLRDICRDWLGMKILSGQEERMPDIVLWSDDVLPESFGQIQPLARTPNVVVCQNVLVAYQRLSAYDSAGQVGIFEFVSQPIGPRKLAKSISRAYKRWMGLPKLVSSSRPALHRSVSSYASHLPSTKFTQQHVASSGSITNSESQTQIEVGDAEDSHRDRATKKILLVDDNYINLKILSTYLGKRGYAYETAINGLEAVEAYTQNPSHYKGILMDLSMPVMDGFQATRDIRLFEDSNRLSAVPIFALTGLASDSAHRAAIESGVDLFLTKPVKLKALSSVLELMHTKRQVDEG